MRYVTMTDPGRLEVAWMWLPFWLAINQPLKARLDEILVEFVGREVDDALLQEAHDAVLAALQKEFPELTGLTQFLEGIRLVQG